YFTFAAPDFSTDLFPSGVWIITLFVSFVTFSLWLLWHLLDVVGTKLDTKKQNEHTGPNPSPSQWAGRPLAGLYCSTLNILMHKVSSINSSAAGEHGEIHLNGGRGVAAGEYRKRNVLR